MIVDGWLHTGDVGRVDDDGYLSIAGRTKEMIKSGGLAVWPGEVEDAIATHPAVSEVAVAGIEDPYQGESVKAWVVPSSGASVNADDLREWVRPRLAAYKVPREFEFRETLPKRSSESCRVPSRSRRGARGVDDGATTATGGAPLPEGARDRRTCLVSSDVP